MEVTLIGFTKGVEGQEPEKLVEVAGRICHRSEDKITGDSQVGLIQKLKEWGHLSPLEHVSFTFLVSGISRACSHQLVRHRLASYSQQSQRYVSESNFEYVTPPSVDNDEKQKIFHDTMDLIRQQYQRLVALGVKKEDARYVLPNACGTSLVVTMNARELLHFFELRLHRSAQWEIREMAGRMLALAHERAPTIFAEIYARHIGSPAPGSRHQSGGEQAGDPPS